MADGRLSYPEYRDLSLAHPAKARRAVLEDRVDWPVAVREAFEESRDTEPSELASQLQKGVEEQRAARAAVRDRLQAVVDDEMDPSSGSSSLSWDDRRRRALDEVAGERERNEKRAAAAAERMRAQIESGDFTPMREERPWPWTDR